MRTRLAALLTVLATVGAYVGIAGAPAANASLGDQPFSASGTGTVLGLNALALGSTTLAATNIAHSGGSVNSQGLTAIADELGQNISPARPDKNAYGRGAGAQVGVGTPVPSAADANAINVAGLAQAFAPPPSTDLKTIPINLPPALSVAVATGQASALYDPDFCPVGKAFTYGEGESADAQVLNPGNNPLVSSTLAGQNVSESRTVTYAIPNGDGTFGVVSETRQTVAPIAVGPSVAGIPALSIEVVGPLIMRVIATGKPGGSRIEFPGTAVITVKAAGLTVLGPVTLASLLGMNGLALNVPLVANLNLGVPPHAIGGAAGSPVTASADGTTAAASVDVVKLQLLQGLLGLNAPVDLRVAHMEGSVTVPAGGLTCNIPVSKAGSPDPVQAGQDFTITITIPSDAAQFSQLFGCDLIGISVTDVHSVESGSPTFTLLSADHGGVIQGDGKTVVWNNIGDYHIGDPPIELHVMGHIPANSPAGVLKDTADVSATLGNCQGGANGQDIVGQGIGSVTDTSIGGTFTLIGPDVSRAGNLAATGGDGRLLLLGGFFLLGALAVRRRLHRPSPTTTTG